MSGKSSGKRAQAGLCGWLQLNQQTESTQRPRKKRANVDRKWENVSFGNAPMLIRRGCMAASERRTTKESLASLDDWDENVTIMMYGKEAKMRRRVCQFSQTGELRYSYSGLSVVAPKIPPVIRAIQVKVERTLREYVSNQVDKGKTKPGGTSSEKISEKMPVPDRFIQLLKTLDAEEDVFNYVLLNHYRTGVESMGYHSDDESSLDPACPIVSISLGATRSFDIRPKKMKQGDKQSRIARIPLRDGDMLVMFPPMQQHYEHSVPVEKRVLGDRINLTFRRVRQMSG
mmetsp:Transcript_31352/g.74806  ORF Transcript_31352/g.74806 Transcript_31352/m.74806 type:complete len:287 (-) Transcript_31352:76-936(-)